MILEIIFFISIFLIFYSIFLYPLLLSFITRFYEKKTDIAKPEYKVSLIIAAYNEEKDIEGKILNSFELDYKDLEIIVVSDGSEDRTNEICRKYADRINFMELKPRSGKINALNHAVPLAKGEIIVFSDANTYYEKNAITELVKHFHDKSVGCVTGYVRLIAEGKHKQGEGIYTRIERSIQINESKIHSVIGIDGAMYAIRKELYESLKGYFIEDFVMGMNIIRKGYRTIYDVEARGWEESSPGYAVEMKRRSRIVAGGFQSLSAMLFLFKRPGLLFFFFSHKFLRWITAELLITIFILNLFLLYNPFFTIVLSLQIVFYALALLGAVWQKVSFFTYFILMQIASLNGLFKYIFKVQKVTWAKAKR